MNDYISILHRQNYHCMKISITVLFAFLLSMTIFSCKKEGNVQSSTLNTSTNFNNNNFCRPNLFADTIGYKDTFIYSPDGKLLVVKDYFNGKINDSFSFLYINNYLVYIAPGEYDSIELNQNGFLIKKIFWNSKTSSSLYFLKYSYDNNNRVNKISTYNMRGETLEAYVVYYYDQAGNVSKEVTYFGLNDPYDSSIYTYDSKINKYSYLPKYIYPRDVSTTWGPNNLIAVTSYSMNGVESGAYSYKYDSSGYPTKYYDPKFNFTDYFKYKCK